jgi:hypothetical protein
MSAFTKSAAKVLLRGITWIFFAIAGLAFWVGGRAINEFAKTERMLAEMLGIAIATTFAGLGALAKAAADHFDDEREIFSRARGQ